VVGSPDPALDDFPAARGWLLSKAMCGAAAAARYRRPLFRRCRRGPAGLMCNFALFMDLSVSLDV
jgi:hypothetical protein